MTRRLWIGAGAPPCRSWCWDMEGHACRSRTCLIRLLDQLVFATPVIVWGRLAVLRARRAIRWARMAFKMFTLIALGTGTAFLYSLVATPLGRPSISSRPR